MARLIGKKSKKVLFCYNNEIGVVDNLPLKEIVHKVDSDTNSGWEDEVDSLVGMVEEMKVDESI